MITISKFRFLTLFFALLSAVFLLGWTAGIMSYRPAVQQATPQAENWKELYDRAIEREDQWKAMTWRQIDDYALKARQSQAARNGTPSIATGVPVSPNWSASDVTTTSSALMFAQPASAVATSDRLTDLTQQK